MSRWAIAPSGVVENIIVWEGDQADLAALFGLSDTEIINVDDILCDIGWVYSGGSFSDPNYVEPSNQELYQSELVSLAATYNADITSLSDQYAKAALIDGTSEQTKKAAIYAEYQARKVTYQTDLAALKVKYGV